VTLKFIRNEAWCLLLATSPRLPSVSFPGDF
jgi:hypothetical protein